MSEFKTLNGYEVKDNSARNGLNALGQNLSELQQSFATLTETAVEGYNASWITNNEEWTEENFYELWNVVDFNVSDLFLKNKKNDIFIKFPNSNICHSAYEQLEVTEETGGYATNSYKITIAVPNYNSDTYNLIIYEITRNGEMEVNVTHRAIPLDLLITSGDIPTLYYYNDGETSNISAFQNFVITSGVPVGITNYNLDLNGDKYCAIVHKIDNDNVSFILYANDTPALQFRYINNNWVIERIGESINNASTLIESTAKQTFTPTDATSDNTWGGCFYYKVGSRVHVHIAINDLVQDPSYTVTNIFTLPQGYRPTCDIFFNGRGTLYTNTAKGHIDANGDIDIASETTDAYFDFEFDAFN